MATSITSAAELFVQKCADSVQNVITLTQKKINNPGSIVNFQASGALVEAVSGNLGPIASFGESYIKNNAEALVIDALGATTIGGVNVGQSAKEGLDFFLNTMSSSVATYNDLILIMTKQSAKRILQDLDTKREIRTNLLEKLNAYVNTLEQMRKGPSVFDAYLDNLREALLKVDEAEGGLSVVTSTLRATDQFLDRRFQEAKDLLDEADVLIKPADNPYLDPKFISNQTILEKKTTGSTRNDITEESDDGSVDPGNPEFLEGSFASSEEGDFVRVTFPIPTAGPSPINQGIYRLVKKISSKKVKISGPSLSVGLSGEEIPFVVGYEPTIISVSNANTQSVQPGDFIFWEGANPFEAEVVSRHGGVVSQVANNLTLDKAVIVTPETEDGVFRVERGPFVNREIVLEEVVGKLTLGKAIEGTPVSKTPVFNSQFESTDPITGVTYQVSRQDGLQADFKTLIDSNADFLEQNLVGQILKISKPGELKGSYKVKSVLNSTTLEIVNPIIPDPVIPGPVFDTEYLVKADLGIPTDADQFANIMAIPAMTNQVVLAGKSYFGATLRVNSGLDGFSVALDALLDSLPAVMKKYVLKLLDRAVQNTGLLKGNMATLLNGSSVNISSTNPGFSPDAIKVSSFAFKWSIDLNLIIAALGIVPSDALANINLSSAPLAAYRNAVERLQLIDDFSSSGAVVTGEDGKEDILQLETQLFTLLTQGNTLIFTGDLREEIISLGRSIIRNIELAQSRDDDVAQILETWIAFPIPLEDEINEILKGLNDLLKTLNLDKAFDLFNEGKFEDLLGLNNGKAATYIGAALSGLALLKDCFDTPEESEDLGEIINELQKEEQLLDVKFSIDFDLGIFKAIEECTRFENLSNLLNLKEIFCGLAQQAAAGLKLDAVGNSVNSGTSSPAQKVAGNLIGL